MSAPVPAAAAAPPSAGVLVPPQLSNLSDRPSVSVVVPTCNRPQLLLRCLDALLEQSLPAGDFEILVVDDAPSDATRAAVEGRARSLPGGPLLSYIRPATGKGPAVARNCGWRAARAEVVAFTDDDTVPDRDWLRAGLEALVQGGGEVAAVAGRVIVPRPPGAAALPTDHELMTRGLETTEFVTANAFVRRVALERVGGFDERFRRPWREDSDLQFRLQDSAGTVRRCEDAVVVHPVRPETWGVSLRQQKNVFYDALLHAKDPRRYRQRVRRAPPWDYYAIVTSTAAAAAFGVAGARTAALVCAAAAGALVLRFAARRLGPSARTPAHVAEMLLTSAAIPFLSVYWRLRGALHFRTWFI